MLSSATILFIVVFLSIALCGVESFVTIVGVPGYLKLMMSSADESMFERYNDIATKIRQKHASSGRKQSLIGIAGPPGAGKSTICSRMRDLLPGVAIVPMDGYHYTKSRLTTFDDPEQAFLRRGSHWTFDGHEFLSAIESLRMNQGGIFPSFDHKIGDPIANAIRVEDSDEYVIVEGNYLLLDIPPWNRLKSLFDFTIYIDCDEERLRQRVISRHMSVGCSRDRAILQYEKNDKLNAIEISQSKYRADYIVRSE